MTQPAMLAKLTTPRVGSTFARKRLFKQLDEFIQHPVTWISAPAGAGKTTILRALLERIEDNITVGLITNTARK